MKMYLEIIEQLSEEEMGFKQPQSLRLEARDERDAERLLKLNIGQFDGLTVIKRIHSCQHEDGLPCQLKEII